MDALRLAGLTVKSVIVWDKKAHGMGDLKGSFAPRYEVIIFAAKGIGGLIDYLDELFSGKRHLHTKQLAKEAESNQDGSGEEGQA